MLNLGQTKTRQVVHLFLHADIEHINHTHDCKYFSYRTYIPPYFSLNGEDMNKTPNKLHSP